VPEAALVLPLCFSLASPARAEEADEREWTAVSPNAEMVAHQVSKGKGCHFEVTRGKTVVWKADKCLGDRTDEHFVDNSGLDILVVRTFPLQRGAIKSETGVELYKRGELQKRWPVGQFVTATGPLVMASKHFYWVEGSMGQTGVPPGYSRDGKAVELTTMDGKSWSLTFDGSVKKIKAPKPLVH
jgi:hypothetical protein